MFSSPAHHQQQPGARERQSLVLYTAATDHAAVFDELGERMCCVIQMHMYARQARNEEASYKYLDKAKRQPFMEP